MQICSNKLCSTSYVCNIAYVFVQSQFKSWGLLKFNVIRFAVCCGSLWRFAFAFKGTLTQIFPHQVLPRKEMSSTFEYMFKIMYNQSHETRTLVIYQYVDKALFMVVYPFLRATCWHHHFAKLTYIHKDLCTKCHRFGSNVINLKQRLSWTSWTVL